MVLSDRTINEELDKGRIVISPLDPSDIRPASVDLHQERVPITLYFGMKIGQIPYPRLTTAVDRLYGPETLGSKYQGQTGPTPSRFHLDFER